MDILRVVHQVELAKSDKDSLETDLCSEAPTDLIRWAIRVGWYLDTSARTELLHRSLVLLSRYPRHCASGASFIKNSSPDE